MKLNDLTGKTFGWLSVIERAENAIKRCGKIETQWLCKCSCGKYTVVRYKNLISGHTKSCGCKKYIKEKKMKVEVITRCVYNPVGVVCNSTAKCGKCGWNPANEELRQRRVAKLMERKSGDE